MFKLADLGNKFDNSTVMIEFHEGDVVRKLREKRKLSRKKLAQMAEMRQATLGRIERTGKYRPEKLQDLARVLKSSPAEIHGLVPVPQSPIKAEPAPAAPSACPDGNADHNFYHDQLETILHSGEKEFVDGIVSNLKAMSLAAKIAALAERKHGSFSVTGSFESGQDFEIRENKKTGE